MSGPGNRTKRTNYKRADKDQFAPPKVSRDTCQGECDSKGRGNHIVIFGTPEKPSNEVTMSRCKTCGHERTLRKDK